MKEGIRCEVCFHKIKDLSLKLMVDDLRVCPECYDHIIDKERKE